VLPKDRYIFCIFAKNNIGYNMICKNCCTDSNVKNGYVRGKQRYKCKLCGFNFTIGDKKEKISPPARVLAILLYGSGKARYDFIAKLLKVSSVAVMKLIKREADKMPEPEICSSIQAVFFDEMWHFVEQKTNKLWVWRAVECSRNRTIGWCVGDRSTETFRSFYQNFKHLDAKFYSDDWDSYGKIISEWC